MNIRIVVLLLLIVVFSVANTTSKFWVSEQYNTDYAVFYYIQDNETGTRCYGIVAKSTMGNGSGASIDCVPNSAPLKKVN